MKFKGLFKFLAFSLLFVCQLAVADGWPVLSQMKEGKSNFTLEYDVSSRKVRFVHKRGWSKKPKFSKTFSVNTDADVDTAKLSVESYLQSVEIPGQTSSDFLGKFNELQFLNMSQCEVIHFHSMNPGGDSNFGELLSEVERINALERMGPESYRSIPLFDVELESEGDFQIRGVLNRSGNITKLSIVKKDGSIKDYKVEREGEDYRFLTPKGELLFVLKPEFNGSEPSKVMLLTSRNQGVQNVHTSYFNLTKANDNWKVDSFTTNPKMDSNLNSVPLIRFNVEHEPVLSINGTDSFFKAIDEDELESVLTKLEITDGDSDHFSSLIRKEFARCMLDRVQVEKDANKEDLRSLCLIVSEIEAVHEHVKKQAAIELESMIDDRMILNESIKSISQDFRDCLGKEKGFDQKRDYLSYDYTYMGTYKTKTKQSVDNCREEMSSSVAKIGLSEKIRSDSDVADIIPEGQVFEDFLLQVINEGYEGCLKKMPKKYSECSEFASLYKDTLVFSADISHRFWQKNERSEVNIKKHGSLIGDYKSCIKTVQEELLKAGDINFNQAETDQSKCASQVLLGLGVAGNSYSFEKILGEIEFFKNRKYEINEELKKKAADQYNACFTEAVKTMGSSLEQFDALKYSCAVEAAKEIIPELFSGLIIEEMDDYVWEEKQKEGLTKYIERLISRRISNLNTPTNINDALEKEIPTVISKALNGVIDSIMIGNFSDEDNFLFNSEAQKQLEKKLFYLIGGNSNKPLSYELKLFVLKEYEKNGIQGARLSSNAFLQNFIKEAIPFIAVKDVGNDVFIKADRESIAGVVDKDIQACIDQFRPDSKVSLKKVFKYCEKKRYGLTQFLLAKRDFETQVSHHFTLSSDAGNRALAPVHYMKECVDNLDKKNFEVGDYEKNVSACINLTKIKISSNIDKERVKKFKPYMKSHTGGSERYSGMTSAYCHNMIFVQLTKELGDSSLSQKIHNREDDLVRSMLTSGNMIYQEDLIEALAANDKLDGEWFDKKLKDCRDGTHSFLMSGLKNYLVNMIPASAYSSTNRAGQSNKEVLESFLDGELLELVLQLKVTKGDKGGELNSAEKDPAQKIVTSTLTLEALSNFMKILGNYITDGFIYDKDKMKTELVIFREELKTALKWVNNQSRPIRIAELGDFFTESTFADHLAQATISEMVRDNFNDFLRDMEQDELRASRQGSGHSSSEVRSKFNKLRAHTRKMTDYYDFRHIIRPKSIKGGRLLKLIKENNLLPRLVGDKVSTYTKEKIKLDVANMILEDNTEGGFAELFVKEVAQLELAKEKDSHWGITRYLFYDTGDFDWATLRKTKSGKKAIEYYGKNLLLPRMLGKELTTYEENSRMKRFRRILRDAISEND